MKTTQYQESYFLFTTLNEEMSGWKLQAIGTLQQCQDIVSGWLDMAYRGAITEVSYELMAKNAMVLSYVQAREKFSGLSSMIGSYQHRQALIAGQEKDSYQEQLDREIEENQRQQELWLEEFENKEDDPAAY